MKKWIYILIIIPAFLFSLPFDITQKADLGNRAFMQGNYEQALSLYREVLQDVSKLELKEEFDKQIVEEIRRSVKEVQLLLKAKPVLPLFKNVLTLEKEEKYNQAVAQYFEIREYLLKENLSKAPYFEDIVKGTLEEFLREQKKNTLDKFSYSFFEKVQADKKRKKRMAFLDFERGPGASRNVENLVTQNLSNVIRISGSFRLVNGRFSGSYKNQLNQAKEQNIDLLITGNYQNAPGDSILLYFSVVDPYLDKKLITATIRMPLDYDFFDTIERISRDMSNKLENYSRLETFDLVKYSKEKGKSLVQEKVDMESQRNLQDYVNAQILAMEKSYLASLEKEAAKELLPAYNKIGLEIADFNKKSFPEKLDYEKYITPRKELLKSAMMHKTDLNEIMVNMYFTRQAQDYKEYYSLYEDTQDEIEDLNDDYQGLKPVIREIGVHLENDKIEVDAIVAKIGMRVERRHGLKLAVKGYTGKKEESHESTQNYSVLYEENAGGLLLGYQFDRRLYKDLWFFAGLGAGVRGVKVQFDTGTTQAVQTIETGLGYFDLGFKYFLLPSFSVHYGIHYEGYFNGQSGDIVSLDSSPALMLGGEYYLNIARWLDLGISLTGALQKNRFSIEDRTAFGDVSANMDDNEMRYNEFSLQFAITGYYNSYEYNLPYPEYQEQQGFWISLNTLPALQFEAKDVENFHDGIRSESFNFGVGLGYALRKGIRLSLDTYLVGFNMDESEYDSFVPYDAHFQASLKGVLQLLTFDADIVEFWGFSGGLNFGLGYLWFYDRSGSLKENFSGTDKPISSYIDSFYPIVLMPGLYLNYGINDSLNIKLFFNASFEIKEQEFMLFGTKIEFKI
jgi:hypothetical protein